LVPLRFGDTRGFEVTVVGRAGVETVDCEHLVPLFAESDAFALVNRPDTHFKLRSQVKVPRWAMKPTLNARATAERRRERDAKLDRIARIMPDNPGGLSREELEEREGFEAQIRSGSEDGEHFAQTYVGD
jgi:hypothetical protein